MASRKFQRKIEDFVCEYCGQKVNGDGYTNHCPNCLWSKHVDIWPGDRQNKCQGLMEPMEAYFKNGVWHLIHQCQKCGESRVIKIKKAIDIKKIQGLVKLNHEL